MPLTRLRSRTPPVPHWSRGVFGVPHWAGAVYFFISSLPRSARARAAEILDWVADRVRADLEYIRLPRIPGRLAVFPVDGELTLKLQEIAVSAGSPQPESEPALPEPGLP